MTLTADRTLTDYHAFLERKIRLSEDNGVVCDRSEINTLCKPHQKDIIQWAVAGGRRAVFASFGLGKTIMQLEIARLILSKVGGMGLIVLPLGVRQEFRRDAGTLGINARFIRSTAEVDGAGIYLTNYESIREGKLDPSIFTVVSLDEAAVLRSSGSKTFGEFLFGPMMKVPYRFVATAVPDPNEYLELIYYAHFLGIMDMGEAKTRFFKRDSTKADHLTLHPHKTEEFWLWVASWAIFVQKPSDLGYSDEGYALPPLDIRWHEIPTDHSRAGQEKNGQCRLLHDTAKGISGASEEKRESLVARMQKLSELRNENIGAHRVIWHDLEDERRELWKIGINAVYGSQNLDKREALIADFADGEIRELAAKPVMLGSGVNLQRHCSWAIFLGIGFKFNDFIQAIHRLHRFLQAYPVRIDIIYTEAEREVRVQLERKWDQYNNTVARMAEIIGKYGLSRASLASALTRSIGVLCICGFIRLA